LGLFDVVTIMCGFQSGPRMYDVSAGMVGGCRGSQMNRLQDFGGEATYCSSAFADTRTKCSAWASMFTVTGN